MACNVRPRFQTPVTTPYSPRKMATTKMKKAKTASRKVSTRRAPEARIGSISVSSSSATSSSKPTIRRGVSSSSAATAAFASKKAKVAPEEKAASKGKEKAAAALPKGIFKGTRKASTSTPTVADVATANGKKGSNGVPAKPPLAATKPVLSSDEEDEEDFVRGAVSEEGSATVAAVDDDGEESNLDSEGKEEMSHGTTSDDRQGEDHDEEDSSDGDDEDAIAKLSEIAASKLPSSKDDEAIKARLAKVEAKRKAQPASQKVDRAVLYLGHLPRHFTEGPLRSYLSQFGTVTRLRLSRNKRTGASKHYAFVEFADKDVAEIVRETMDNYLILGQLLKVKSVDKNDVHPTLWIGANRTYRKVPQGRRVRVQHDGPKTQEGKQRAERKLLERQEKRKAALKEQGYDYEFEGYSKVHVKA